MMWGWLCCGADSVRPEPDDTCVVCLEDYVTDPDFTSLKCKHIFHRACLRTWTEINNTCPICRSLINRVERSSGNEVDIVLELFEERYPQAIPVTIRF